MKKIILIGCLFVSFTTYAQQDTTLVEQYCQVIATSRLLSNKVTIVIDYGEERSIWKDNRIKQEDGKARKFNTVIDALNFLGKAGWKLVNAFPASSGNEPMLYHYVFKKTFEAADTE